MNKKRNAYIYHLVGVISKSFKYQISEGKYQGNDGWKLLVTIETEPTIKVIKVYSNSLENKAIYQTLQTNEYLGKRYIFHCRNWSGNYYLINWEETNSSPENKENHGSN